MEITAFDAARWQLIPHTAKAILPYADGRYAWSNTHFPTTAYRYITVLGNPAVDIIDFEPGCVFNTATLQNWAHQRASKGLDITVYTYRDAFQIVEKALARFEWHLWLATLDGTKLTSYNGKALRGCQYTDRQGLYDMSVIYDSEWLLNPVRASVAYVNVEVVPWGDPAPWNSTVYGIASHFGVTEESIYDNNPQINRKTSILYPGELVKVIA